MPQFVSRSELCLTVGEPLLGVAALELSFTGLFFGRHRRNDLHGREKGDHT